MQRWEEGIAHVPNSNHKQIAAKFEILNRNGVFQTVPERRASPVAVPVSYDLTSISYGATGLDKLARKVLTMPEQKDCYDYRKDNLTECCYSGLRKSYNN